MWSNRQFPADLFTFTKQLFNGKLHLLCKVCNLHCLFPGNPPSTEKPYDVYPIKITSNNKTQLVVQAYAHAKYLGFLNVTFNEEGEIVMGEGNPILINHSAPVDLEVGSEKKKLQQKVKNIAKVNS